MRSSASQAARNSRNTCCNSSGNAAASRNSSSRIANQRHDRTIAFPAFHTAPRKRINATSLESAPISTPQPGSRHHWDRCVPSHPGRFALGLPQIAPLTFRTPPRTAWLSHHQGRSLPGFRLNPTPNTSHSIQISTAFRESAFRPTQPLPRHTPSSWHNQ